MWRNDKSFLTSGQISGYTLLSTVFCLALQRGAATAAEEEKADKKEAEAPLVVQKRRSKFVAK